MIAVASSARLRPGRSQQDLDLLAAQPGPPRLGLLQLLDLRLDRVVLDQLVADGGVEDLPQPGQRLVDRPVRQRPLDQALLALADLGRLVAVDLLGGDLREPVVLEEGQQVVPQRELVVLDRSRRELVAARVQPLGGELVEGRLARLGRLRVLRRPPDPAAHVGEDVGQLLLGLVARPALGGAAERHVAALAVGAEAQGEGAALAPSNSTTCPLPSRHLAYLMRLRRRVNSPRLH